MFELTPFERWTVWVMGMVTCITSGLLVYGAFISPTEDKWKLVIVAMGFMSIASLLFSVASVALALIHSHLSQDAMRAARKAQFDAGTARTKAVLAQATVESLREAAQ